jgi:hypothetical protein
MNPRERMLAMVVGSVGVLLGLWFAWSYVDGQFRTRRTKIATLEDDIVRFKKQAMQGQRARSKLADYEARSLPPNQEMARSLYLNWLLSEMVNAGFAERQAEPKAAQREGDLYVSQPFVVSGKATLPQVIDFLHAFYSVDYLHRVRTMMLKPIKDSKQMDVTLHIDAVSVSNAPEATALHGRPSQRLALATKDDYYKSILGRNLFGPANREPSLSIDGSKSVTINRPTAITAKGTDPDRLDSVKYRLIETDAPDAKLDPVSGRLSWTPKALGKRKFVIEAYDDGYPSKTDREELVLNVVNPPSPVAPPPPRDVGFQGFDKSKYTVLIGVVEVNGESEIWLLNRPDGKKLELRVGDEFEIGSVKGTVESIDESSFTFMSKGKLRKLELRGVLEQAATISQATQPAEAVAAPDAEKAALRSGSDEP